MLDFLNQNSDAIQAFVAVAQTFFALVLAGATIAYARYSKKLVDEMRRQNRPYVSVEVVKRGALLDTVVRNTGGRGAEDVCLEVHQDVVLGDERGVLGWPLFKNPIPFLPPGQSVSQQVAHLPSVKKPEDASKLVLHYTVCYCDGSDKYKQRVAYDLSFLFPVGGDAFPLAGNYLAIMAEEVKELKTVQTQNLVEIRESLRRIANSLAALSKDKEGGF